VISGTDIDGEIPVQAIFKGGKRNDSDPDQYFYWAQNKERIILSHSETDSPQNYSVNGQLSKIKWSNKSIKDNSDFVLYGEYMQSLDRSTLNLKQGKYKVRKL
jgi:hypothetical protein